MCRLYGILRGRWTHSTLSRNERSRAGLLTHHSIAQATSVAHTSERSAMLRAVTMRTRSTRELMSSFRKMCRRWESTVCGDRNSLEATSRLVRPSATSSVTACSASVRLSQPNVGRRGFGEWVR